jgi:aerobic carbon-monoxide dehydrogenase large subunit
VRPAPIIHRPAAPPPSVRGQYGRSVKRVEDERLLRGKGRYLDDVSIGRVLHAAFLRSPQAHASLLACDVSRAQALSGVVAVYTGQDLGTHNRPLPPVSSGSAMFTQLPLAEDEVCYVGQTVAMVVAESRYLAEDALELIELELEPLPVVVDLDEAVSATAPRSHVDRPNNVAAHVVQMVGDPDAAFANADIVLRERYVLERSAGMPLEGRGVAATYDARSKELTVWDSTQAPHAIRDGLATFLDLPEEKVHVIAPDTGGGFGTKVMLFYPEETLVPWAAIRLGRPVKWIEDRSEHFVASNHERRQIHDVELAATEDGLILALRDSFLHDAGAFVPTLDVPIVTASQLPGPYEIPSMRIEFKALLTNTVPVTPYRGCGRPHACFVMERLLDRLAKEIGIDRAEIRRRNLIKPKAFPYRRDGLSFADGLPVVLDSGNYEAVLDAVLEAIDYRSFREERERARAAGSFLGLGLACYIEGTGLGPHEGAHVEIDPGGKILVCAGVASQGQSHCTTLAQVAADVFDVELEQVCVSVGDTRTFANGLGTFASRTAVVAGNAVFLAAEQVRDQALDLAAALLEAPRDQLELSRGSVVCSSDTSRAVTLAELVAAAESSSAGPDDGRIQEPPLAATAYFRPPHAVWASGAHAAVVEIDRATGRLTYRRYAAVHDCGSVINPRVVEGQIMGGIAQGIGGSFYERLAYDEDGQLRNGSFMDFLIPYATETPPMRIEHLETVSPLNPLGIKGAGEAGAIPVPAVTASAIDDAFAELGVEVKEMPLDPTSLLMLIEAATRAREAA